ncbi:MAG: hypothetical protein ACTS2F_19490 [Thainema sp.]
MNRQPDANHGSHSHGDNLQPQTAMGSQVSTGSRNDSGRRSTPTTMGLA